MEPEFLMTEVAQVKLPELHFNEFDRKRQTPVRFVDHPGRCFLCFLNHTTKCVI